MIVLEGISLCAKGGSPGLVRPERWESKTPEVYNLEYMAGCQEGAMALAREICREFFPKEEENLKSPRDVIPMMRSAFLNSQLKSELILV